MATQTTPVVRLGRVAKTFEEPFTVDSTTFTTRLGMSATALNDAVARTLATYRHVADDGTR